MTKGRKIRKKEVKCMSGPSTYHGVPLWPINFETSGLTC